MTTVLSPADSLRHNRRISLDDNEIDYASSSTDWRAKYNEVVDMLAETRAELDDFHHASKELEAELEAELQRTEKAQQDLKVKVARAETERDEWKSKFMALQTNHNTTTTSLQRELDRLRQEHQQIKIQLRELEMGNDDLERTERAVSSSLADMEAKYSKTLEEKILLEHELIEKASLEEESQRLKDDLRDANVEISILKDQLAAAAASAKSTSHSPSTSMHNPPLSDDNLLDVKPPPDLQLSELGDSSEMPPPAMPSNATPKASISSQSALLQRAVFTKPNHINTSGIARSANLSSSYNSPISSPRTPLPRAAVSRNSSSVSSSSVSSNATVKNKGVQMVSEMRARVRNLEQKIHTRVPRLRMGSITGRQTGVGLSNGNMFSGASSSSSSTSLASTAKTSLESISNRRSHDNEQLKAGKKDKGDTSGWVLIMEDSPSPVKDKERERREKRRPSSPTTAPTSFRSGRAISPTPSPSKSSSLSKSTMNTGLRRPQSRLSGGALSSAVSSIPTPVSRPATPTFLPIPSMPGSSVGLKRSTGPGGPNPYSQLKRSSLGGTTAGKSVNPGTELGRPTSRPDSSTPSSTSSSRYATDDYKHLPKLPALHSNITVRPPAKPGSAASSALSKSRIGRPSGNPRRNSGDAVSDMLKDTRFRSSNTTTT